MVAEQEATEIISRSFDTLERLDARKPYKPPEDDALLQWDNAKSRSHTRNHEVARGDRNLAVGAIIQGQAWPHCGQPTGLWGARRPMAFAAVLARTSVY